MEMRRQAVAAVRSESELLFCENRAMEDGAGVARALESAVCRSGSEVSRSYIRRQGERKTKWQWCVSTVAGSDGVDTQAKQWVSCTNISPRPGATRSRLTSRTLRHGSALNHQLRNRAGPGRSHGLWFWSGLHEVTSQFTLYRLPERLTQLVRAIPQTMPITISNQTMPIIVCSRAEPCPPLSPKSCSR